MKFKKTAKIVGAILAISSFSFGVQAESFKPDSLKNLQDMEFYDNVGLVDGDGESLGIDNIRIKEMKTAAMAVGAQNGYVHYMDAFEKVIRDKAEYFDKNFDFNALMKMASSGIEDLYFLPPVISHVDRRVISSEKLNQITLINDEYTLNRPGMLVSTAPNWRQYLLFGDNIEVVKPSPYLLPKAFEEKSIWAEYVEKGWLEGYKQADREMLYRARKLGNDHKGMVLYMRLVAEGKVNKPVLISTTDHATGNDKLMRVNEHVIRLAVPAMMNRKSDQWKALILDDRESLRYPIEFNEEQ